MAPRRREVPGRHRASSGKVVSLTDYGAFIEIEQGVEGLVHVSEMSWTKRVKHPSKMVEVGDRGRGGRARHRPAPKRIALGMKQIEPNPWTLLEDKYPVGTVIKGQVRNITDFGIFVGVEEGIDGLVHVSRHLAGPSGSSTRRAVPEGRRGRGGGAQHRRRERALSAWASSNCTQIRGTRSPSARPCGSRVKGKVTKVTDFGAFVEIEPGHQAWCTSPRSKDERGREVPRRRSRRARKST